MENMLTPSVFHGKIQASLNIREGQFRQISQFEANELQKDLDMWMGVR